jgi:hypothetical protein
VGELHEQALAWEALQAVQAAYHGTQELTSVPFYVEFILLYLQCPSTSKLDGRSVLKYHCVNLNLEYHGFSPLEVSSLAASWNGGRTG